jgi:hypothetical protein
MSVGQFPAATRLAASPHNVGTAMSGVAHEHAAGTGRQPMPRPPCGARACATFALARRPRRGACSGPRSTAAFHTPARLRHMDGEATTRHRGKGPHRQRLDGGGVDGVDRRRQERTNMCGSAATCTGRWRRGEVADNRSTQRRKRVSVVAWRRGERRRCLPTGTAASSSSGGGTRLRTTAVGRAREARQRSTADRRC